VGKLQLAERFAQLLLCEAAEAAHRAVRSCDGCRWFLAGHHPDVRFVEPETIARRARDRRRRKRGKVEGQAERGDQDRRRSRPSPISSISLASAAASGS
jgi:DNA polymerase-3 subunit delta'